MAVIVATTHMTLHTVGTPLVDMLITSKHTRFTLLAESWSPLHASAAYMSLPNVKTSPEMHCEGDVHVLHDLRLPHCPAASFVLPDQPLQLQSDDQHVAKGASQLAIWATLKY